jgi:hypothetical protein
MQPLTASTPSVLKMLPPPNINPFLPVKKREDDKDPPKANPTVFFSPIGAHVADDQTIVRYPYDFEELEVRKKQELLSFFLCFLFSLEEK